MKKERTSVSQNCVSGTYHCLSFRMDSSISVLLFGITRDLTGQSAVSVSLQENASVADLLEQLHQQFPALTGIRSLLIAVNGEYAETDQVLSPTDEIALIPPVSGG
ncbi:MoaD/ThiS family protein [Spirosoma spitsbergense]|uniref:MoaD/ThiS family protein n=1 Tax=Spirosoma spitsbergense TaxID=431554 RepID=UPI003CCB8DB0